MLLALARAPRSVIIEKMLPIVDNALAVLKDCEGDHDGYPSAIMEASKTIKKGSTTTIVVEKDAGADSKSNSKEGKEGNASSVDNGYWDDYCLAHFLKGVCLRYVEFPVGLLLYPTHIRDKRKAVSNFLTVAFLGPICHCKG